MSLGPARYSYGGDEHIFVELIDATTLEAFFKGRAITGAVPEMLTRRPSTTARENPITGSNGDPAAINRRPTLIPPPRNPRRRPAPSPARPGA